MSIDLYQLITDQVVAMLERGVAPWRSPILGRTSAGQPRNLETGKPYRGINVFLLAFAAHAQGYGSSYWLTFNQAKAQGGVVKKGEKSTMVVFWKQYRTADRQIGEDVTVPVLRYYNCFNVEQCDGIKAPDAVTFEPTDFQPIAEAEKIMAEYVGGPTVEHGGSQAYYRPGTDTIRMPEPTRFTTAEEYFSTLYHEAAHSTGHSQRLDRGLDTQVRPFGSPDYGKEELVAEMAAAFLCGHVGIQPAVIENQAAYLQGWLKQLRNDKKLVIAAAGAGQRAADWIRNIRGQPTP